MTKKITIAMSGGVDSGAAAYLLHRDGYECYGVTFDMNGNEDGKDARAICDALGFPHETEDATADFAMYVRDMFAPMYERGLTPNPCVVCNKNVKFPRLIATADRYNCDLAATGHYARVAKIGDSYYIRKGADSLKDQSYMLWALPEEIISRMVFPLGEYTKQEIREIAREAALPCHASPDSQDICFIPDGDFRGYLDRTLGPANPGEFVDKDGNVLGTHIGQRYFTIGQSRGLGIALGRRMYVLNKDFMNNRVVLGDESDLYRTEVTAVGIRLCQPLEKEQRLSVKLRYTRNENTATVVQTAEDMIVAKFDEPVRAPAKGQSMVLYDGDIVVGGGYIFD